jgi:hypothetical protein
MYHALALLGVAWAVTRWPGPLTRWAGWLFVIGTVLFTGSLYALALSGTRWLGAITPFGDHAVRRGRVSGGVDLPRLRGDTGGVGVADTTNGAPLRDAPFPPSVTAPPTT